MPKITRSNEEIDRVRLSILESALKLFVEEGFSKFSMRKLASSVGMTAANIYNYYSGKDELYLKIQTRGFEILHEAVNKIYNSGMLPADKLKKMAYAYVEFGTKNPEYYDIMFSRNTPKYSDYLGTGMEPAASIEKQTAMKVASIATRAIKDVINVNRCFKSSDAEFRMIYLWSTLNGVVNLCNSRVLDEVSKDTDKISRRIISELMIPFSIPGK